MASFGLALSLALLSIQFLWAYYSSNAAFQDSDSLWEHAGFIASYQTSGLLFLFGLFIFAMSKLAPLSNSQLAQLASISRWIILGTLAALALHLLFLVFRLS
ncbi:hypothetical protein N8482_01895 [Chitinophagales bacterium]|nr:hypothetical protein [Chitinophagales bacterium]